MFGYLLIYVWAGAEAGLRKNPREEFCEIDTGKPLFLVGIPGKLPTSTLSARFTKEFIQELQWERKFEDIMTANLVLKNMTKAFLNRLADPLGLESLEL